MTIFKLSFAPIIGATDAGVPTPVGRWIVYCVAEHALRIEGVLSALLPDHLKPLATAGFEIEDTIDVPAGKRAWSVSVGPSGKSYSCLVVADDQEDCERRLRVAVEKLPYMKSFVDSGLWQAFPVDLTKESLA